MSKLLTAMIAGLFMSVAGSALANDAGYAARHPVDATKAKIQGEKAENRMENTADAHYKAAKKDADAKYDAAKDQCKSMKGSQESACKKEAKADHDKSIADAKAARDKGKAEAQKSS